MIFTMVLGYIIGTFAGIAIGAAAAERRYSKAHEDLLVELTELTRMIQKR